MGQDCKAMGRETSMASRTAWLLTEAYIGVCWNRLLEDVTDGSICVGTSGQKAVVPRNMISQNSGWPEVGLKGSVLNKNKQGRVVIMDLPGSA
ncbi:hypothetical protein HPP92_028886 [Vanilla planifolia]|uniref:Uncharacterized protein n=1 Tax=Vanilla planifolia TaxID=51239 RepID=A0A835U2W5_VANPL|nr:hypothetical protein HPP92_028886 [Vanilla planifolia]KAG0446347.1 hypothetical protein HPP92_028875 [Vanilla planifolia]